MVMPASRPPAFSRLGIARGNSEHGREAANGHRAARSFRSASNHHVSIAALDDAVGIADGMRAGGARRTSSFVRALGAVANAHLPGGKVDDGSSNEEG